MSRPQTLKISAETYSALTTGKYLKWDGSQMAISSFDQDVSLSNGGTRQVVETYLAANASATALTQNQWDLPAGTWTNSLTKGTQLATGATGRITYTGVLPVILWASCSLSIDPVSGGDRDMHMALFKNGVKVASSELVFACSATRTQSTQLQAFVSVVTNDYLEIQIMNADSGTGATVSYANLMCLVTALA